MSRSLFRLSDEAWAAIEPNLPRNRPGARRVDDRRVISGIIHMLKCGGCWADVPPEYGPPTTIYNRWNRWSRRGRLEPHPLGDDRGGLDRRDRRHRQQLHQGAPLGGGRKRGARAQAIGVSRGGRTTKVHALADVLGRPLRLVLTPGNVSDARGAGALIDAAAGMKRLIADKG